MEKKEQLKRCLRKQTSKIEAERHMVVVVEDKKDADNL